jgi:hypothetical protein
VTADGFLELMFGRMTVFGHLPENGQPGRPLLKLNCPQECLPIGIGGQHCEVLGRHRQPPRLFPGVFDVDPVA